MAKKLIDEEELLGAAGLRSSLLDQITQPELPQSVPFVRVMSLHKSKGLTAEVVIVTGFAEGMIPFVRDGLPPGVAREHLQEQRRLFFVALTRATKVLILSSARRIRRQDARDMGLALTPVAGFVVKTVPSSFAIQLGSDSPPAALTGQRWLATNVPAGGASSAAP